MALPARRLVAEAAHLYALDEYLDGWYDEPVADPDWWMRAVADRWLAYHAKTIDWLLSVWPHTTAEDLVALVDANRAHSERTGADEAAARAA